MIFLNKVKFFAKVPYEPAGKATILSQISNRKFNVEVGKCTGRCVLTNQTDPSLLKEFEVCGLVEIDGVVYPTLKIEEVRVVVYDGPAHFKEFEWDACKDFSKIEEKPTNKAIVSNETTVNNESKTEHAADEIKPVASKKRKK